MKIDYWNDSLTIYPTKISSWQNLFIICEQLKDLFGLGFYSDDTVNIYFHEGMNNYIQKNISDYKWSFYYRIQISATGERELTFVFKDLNDFTLAKLVIGKDV